MGVIPAESSAIILATMGLILAAAVAVFSILARSITVKRKEVALREWAAERGASVVEHRDKLPPLLANFANRHPVILKQIVARNWVLAELSTDAPAEAQGKTPRWRVLACAAPPGSRWPLTGLRPVAHAVSVIDLLGLSSFPSLSQGERFVLFGTEASAAQLLADSPAQGLLPPDVGLLLGGSAWVLDFSSRRFDVLEFERMLDLSAQLASHIAAFGAAPPVAAGSARR